MRMSSTISFLLPCLSLVLSVSADVESAQHVRYVRPDESAPATCHDQPCLPLGQFIQQAETYFTTGATFLFLPGNHTLQSGFNLTDISDIVLTRDTSGSDARNSLIVLQNDGVIWCDNVTNLTIQKLTLVLANVTQQQPAALIVVNSKMTLISSSTFQGTGVSMTGLNFQSSTISIVNCHFDGFAEGAVKAIDSVLAFGSCTFTRNKARALGGGLYACRSNVTLSGNSVFAGNGLLPDGSAVHMAGGHLVVSGRAQFRGNYGGGIKLVGSNALLKGELIEFIHNVAWLGGGIYVDHSGLITSTEQLNFVGNYAEYRGGAIAVDTLEASRYVSIVAAHFIDNSADVCGGAVSADKETNITFTDIVSTGNSGSAFCISNSIVAFNGTMRISNSTGKFGGGIHCRNSVVSVESFELTHNVAHFGGAIYSLHGSIVFQGNLQDTALLAHNTASHDGGALHLTDTEVVMKDLVSLVSNSAQNGGAVYLKSRATLTFNTDVGARLLASYNYASDYGGTIFHEDIVTDVQCIEEFTDAIRFGEIVKELPYCFFKFEGREHYIDFTRAFSSSKNFAREGGIFLYGGLLDRCRLDIRFPAPDNTVGPDISQIPYSLFNYYLGAQITSKPYQLCFCENNYYDCNVINNLTIHRGETFRVYLVALDQLKNPVSTLVTAITSPNAMLQLNQSPRHLPQNCSALTYNFYSTDSQEKLVLYPDGPCHDTGLARAVISVSLLPCPDGFSQSGERCVCERRLQEYDADCVIDETIYITRRAGSMFWVSGLYENGTYQGLVLYGTCPSDNCKNKTVHITLDDPDTQCALNRGGVLCGQCTANHSLTLGSDHCQVCSNAFLSLLFPFAGAGVALVVFLTFLRLTVATGMINSLILYANIVQVNKNLYIPSNTTNVLTVFIAWMNLDLGFETCFYDGMDAYAQTWLQFAFPVYVWTLITLIIVTSRYSIFISKLIGHNPIAVLATLLLMSYTKILKIFIEVYSSVNLDYPDNKTVTVWLKDANVPYLRSKHLLLTVVTTLVLVFFFLPYTLLLLLGYKLYHFTGRKGFRCFSKVRPLLDSYYAPYKKHTRYWTGFLLLVRCALYIVFSYNSLGATSKSLLAVNVTFVALIVIAWLSVRIYKSFFVNVLEAWVYLNLVLLSTATLAGAHSPALAYTLVGAAFATMIGITVYHFHLLYTAKSAMWLGVKAKLSNVFKATESLTANPQPPPGASSSQDQHKMVSKTVIELREPLLKNN